MIQSRFPYFPLRLSCEIRSYRITIFAVVETTEEDLMHTVFPHPTLSEMMHESVLDAYGKVIHT